MRYKTPTVNDDILLLIATHYAGKSGIVYCYSRSDAEEVANCLSAGGVAAAAYHASLPPEVREAVLRRWSSGKVQVVCATIAFGLGINKADVAFVIHHTMAKSVDGYYQETGRAGRNGQPARCILYFRPSDLMRLASMACTESTGITRLITMVQYAQAQDGCRCKLIADYFHEPFDPAVSCKGECCDNCKRKRSSGGHKSSSSLSSSSSASSSSLASDEPVSIQEFAKDLLAITRRLSSKDDARTLPQLVEVWKGNKRKNLQMDDLGKAPKNLSKEDCEAVVVNLIVERVLDFKFKQTAYAINCYVIPGPKAPFVEQGRLSLKMRLPSLSGQGGDAAKAARKASAKSSGKGSGKGAAAAAAAAAAAKESKTEAESAKRNRPSKDAEETTGNNNDDEGEEDGDGDFDIDDDLIVDDDNDDDDSEM